MCAGPFAFYWVDARFSYRRCFMLRYITMEKLAAQVKAGTRPLQDAEFRVHLVRTVEAEQMINNHHENAYYRALAREELAGNRQSKWAA
jgi:hypothetical protein